jgi:carbamoyltransferase
MNTIAVHLYHDSTISMNLDGEFLNIELERLYAKRHYDWRQESESLDELLELIQREHKTFDAGIIVGMRDRSAAELFQRLGVSAVGQVDHHLSHAAAAFYQSPYERSLLISYDGGGNDGTFRTFLGCRKRGVQSLDARWELNLGIPYRALAHPIADIYKPNDERELSNAGKLMGLAAYGQVRPEWIQPVVAYYHACSRNGDSPRYMYRWVVSHLPQLGSQIGLSLSRDAITGTDAFDLAKTAQHVFEILFLERVLPLANHYRLPICISGGCALNVLVNQRLAELVDLPVFVPPNPNDCGLAVGALLTRAAPKEPVNMTYSGLPILDLSGLPESVARFGAIEAQPTDIAQLLFDGCVVAVMRGQAEHGPRALGNRSILCDPSITSMKDRLNARVKFRENFRPYAPVVRAHDTQLYFENAKNDMSFMSFNPTVKQCWRRAFGSAIHVDATARAQTVTSQQNPWLYEVLTEFHRLSGYGALLNTSFNSKGEPMVASVADALSIFFTTDIDCLLVENWLFRKQQTPYAVVRT